MRTALLRSSALAALLRLSSAQSQSETWAQTQPFDVDVSTESLLGSSQQALTNVVAESTPGTTGLAPAVSVTGAFSTSIPTELTASASASGATSVVVVTSTGAGASGSAVSESAASSRSASASASASSSRASSSGTGAAVQSTAAAAPGGVNGQHKMMGVAGALAGAAGVLFV